MLLFILYSAHTHSSRLLLTYDRMFMFMIIISIAMRIHAVKFVLITRPTKKTEYMVQFCHERARVE